MPHTLTLDLGSAKSVRALRYTPRQDGAPNGTFAQYRVETSPDNSTWTVRASGTFASNTQSKQVDWTAVSVRYVRFVEVSEVGGNQFGSAAEVQLLQGP